MQCCQRGNKQIHGSETKCFRLLKPIQLQRALSWQNFLTFWGHIFINSTPTLTIGIVFFSIFMALSFRSNYVLEVCQEIGEMAALPLQSLKNMFHFSNLWMAAHVRCLKLTTVLLAQNVPLVPACAKSMSLIRCFNSNIF